MLPLRSLAAIAAFIMSAMPASAVEIETATGRFTIDRIPERVAVFDIAAIDTLDRIGIRPAGIPNTLYLPQLAHLVDEAEVVGTLFEPDLEALNALAPDLVIVGGRSSPQADATSRVAPTIDMTMSGDDLVAEARDRLVAYGRLFDRASEAEAARRELDDAVAAARAAVAGKGDALIVMSNGPKVSAYGAGSRFGWLHSALGLPPAVADMDAAIHGEAVSFEFIRKADPDWLIVLDRAAAIGEGKPGNGSTLDNALVAETKAWRNGHVVHMPPADLYIAAGGVQAMIRILGVIADAFSKGG